MKITFPKTITIYNHKLLENEWLDILKHSFEYAYNNGNSYIKIGRKQYISIDYYKGGFDSYIELKGTYIRRYRTIADILYILNKEGFILKQK